MPKQNRSQGAKPPEQTWYVYLLRCADGSLYTGIAKDLPRRLERHNAGTASRYTRSRRPTRLVYKEAHAGKGLALRREAAIKALSRRQKEALIRRTG
jgi:predicted GIY-YIG superfamily endonuclease